MYQHVFKIPPDFDDTSVNLGLGSLLKDFIVDFPTSSALWQSQNSNLSSIFTSMKHYAYKPTTNDSRVNTIDTRTYFYMRRFLEDVKAKNKSLSLVTTWVRGCVFCEQPPLQLLLLNALIHSFEAYKRINK